MSITPKNIHRHCEVIIDFDRMNRSGSCSLVCADCLNTSGKYSGQGKQIQWLNAEDVTELLKLGVRHQGNAQYWLDVVQRISEEKQRFEQIKQDNIARVKRQKERNWKNSQIMYGVREPEYTEDYSEPYIPKL